MARLFKTNDVVSLRGVKISNVNISNIPIFFVEKKKKKREKLLQCKGLPHIFQQILCVFGNVVKHLTS